MKTYRDKSGSSGVTHYEEGPHWIRIRFVDGGEYLYDAVRPGAAHVMAMKELARAGAGLATYINQHVRDNYAEKYG